MDGFNRRRLLRAGFVAGGGIAVAGVGGGLAVAGTSRGAGAPALVRSGRPLLTHGVQSGDATAHTAVVWTRADRPGRMVVEVSRDPSFRRARQVRGPVVTPQTGLTGKVRLTDLSAGEPVYYRVRVTDLDSGLASEPLVGSLRTAPRSRRTVRFLWSGDIVGQGFGINADLGGLQIFDAMRRLRPDFFLCSGDTVYADNPLTETVTLPDGRVWRNVVTPEKSKVAETLDEFRGQFAYNLLDTHFRAFAAEVPVVSQWDDHEVINNWSPGVDVTDERYTERRIDVLAARAKQAFHEWVPITVQTRDAEGRIYRKIAYGPHLDLFVLDMRTYKDPNSDNRYADPQRGLLGDTQRAWLHRELAASRATWKVIANDLPLSLVVSAGPNLYEGVAQENHGAPLGRELEFAEVLQAAHRRGVTGIAFLTGDVHYTAAHHYDPARAAVKDFTPFWEFVSGPLHAGGFGPNRLDNTFGPKAEYVHAPPAPFHPPIDGFQHFGEVEIDGESGAMTVRLRHHDGALLWSTTLPAPR